MPIPPLTWFVFLVRQGIWDSAMMTDSFPYFGA